MIKHRWIVLNNKKMKLMKFIMLFYMGLILTNCSKNINPLQGNPNNGQPLSGTWTGTWDFSTTDGTIACMDNKKFILTQVGDNFSGNGSFVTQQPVQSGCETDGTFTIPRGNITGNDITMTWDFSNDVIAKAIGTINADLTVMTLSATETDNGILDGGGDIIITKL
jgi:hypothetical protein